MSKSIFKYPIETTDIQQIEMPYNAEILCLQTQHNTQYIWVLVDVNEPLIQRTFAIFGTGDAITVESGTLHKYIGSYQVHHGHGVFHCFEIIYI